MTTFLLSSSLQPDYHPGFNDILFITAFIYSTVWIFAVARFTRSGFHPSVNWTAGRVLLWSLLMMLWLLWFADSSGYRLLFSPLGKAAPHSMALSFPRE